jgi:hypothetical protein
MTYHIPSLDVFCIGLMSVTLELLEAILRLKVVERDTLNLIPFAYDADGCS